MGKNRMLVIGSHAVDFSLRAGGTILAYLDKGWEVKVIDLTFGARGESDEFWEANPDATEEDIKRLRKSEALEAAAILGVPIEFLDWDDHPIDVTGERVLQLARIVKEYRPRIVLTQCVSDPMNPDHPSTVEAVCGAVRCARVSGVFPDLPKIAPPDLYFFDASAPDYSGFKPDVFIDITPYIDRKMESIAVAKSSKKTQLMETFRARALYRGTNARGFSGDKNIRYAEAFTRFSPYVGKTFE